MNAAIMGLRKNAFVRFLNKGHFYKYDAYPKFSEGKTAIFAIFITTMPHNMTFCFLQIKKVTENNKFITKIEKWPFNKIKQNLGPYVFIIWVFIFSLILLILLLLPNILPSNWNEISKKLMVYPDYDTDYIMYGE